ncbi:MAG: SDR family NAD(P)-dependent oxidoreductase [Bacteroidia bacterium]|nr:SDR family NAD(P)-dependent oxidoreductase [Bacteroidia bacterium]
MKNIFSLEEKNILITGASSGIGKSIAIECSKMGANLIITGRNLIRLNETFQLLSGESHQMICADLVNSNEIKSLTDRLPILDGIVYAAGINTKTTAKYINEEKINAIMKINYYAPALLIQSVLKQKKLQKEASIVIISSIASTYAAVSNAIYASSKGAINSLIRVLALELAPQKIRVNGIQPGMVKTDILEAYDLKEELEVFTRTIPLGRLARPEEIAYAAIYLLSDATVWVTGTSLIIDGGTTLR